MSNAQRRVLAHAEYFQSVALDPQADEWWRAVSDRMCTSLMRIWAASSVAGLRSEDKPSGWR